MAKTETAPAANRARLIPDPVCLRDPGGKWLSDISAKEASALISAGEAEGVGARAVKYVRLLPAPKKMDSGPENRDVDVRRLALASHGSRYVHREHVSGKYYIFQHKPIPEGLTEEDFMAVAKSIRLELRDTEHP
jgi:hypothetical protein